MLAKPDYCRPCSLYGNGQGFSELEGSGQSRLLVLAEALGEYEEEDGLPLRERAPAGGVFQRALREAGTKRNGLLITNVVRCRPPANELLGADYERSAIDHCQLYLDHAVAQYRPHAILALGNTPLRELTAYNGILTYRGFILDSRYDIPLIATYHPSLLARGALGTLFGVFKKDVATAVQTARQGPPPRLETAYELRPTIARVREYYHYLRVHHHLPIAYDVETPGIYGEKEPPRWQDKRIVQIQFSHRAGFAMVLPFEGEYRDLALAILALPNPKWGWNSRSSDDLALRSNGAILNGELHDLMLAWGHLQPDFAGQKEAGGESAAGDSKDMVAKLMNLQSALSFYHPEEGPWKHLSASDVPLYGAKDADYTQRCGVGIFRSLEAQGLLGGYRQHKYELRSVLDDMGNRGLPIDRQKQEEVRDYVQAELARMRADIQTLVPGVLRGIHPKEGQFKTLSPKVKQLVATYDPLSPPLVEYSNFSGYLIPVNGGWAVRKLFNVASSQQLIAYIKYRGYRVPKRIDDPDKDTTGKDELAKLAKETGDELLLLTDQYRKFLKLSGSYVGKVGKDGVVRGDWVPGDDGRVHPEFGWGPASAQLKCVEPNAQQFPEHGPLAKRAKAMIVAERGHLFVKIDMRGFHSRMIGFLAEDEAYYKLADFDVHSFITAHFLHLHDAPYLLEMSDDELHAALKHIKRTEEFTRNYKVKRCVHGRQFNMGVNKLYQMHAPNFDPPAEQVAEQVGAHKWGQWSDEQRAREVSRRGRSEAMSLFRLFDRLFPRTFVAFPAMIENQIRNVTRCRLVSPFGHHRWFWDYDKEKSTAFLPSNCAHCHIQYGLLILDQLGALDKYQLVNFTHDAVWYHCPEPLVSECVEVTKRVLERKSDVLFNKWGAFTCNSDAEVGPSLVQMTAL